MAFNFAATFGDAYDYENITPGDSSTGITASKLLSSEGLPPKAALIQATDNTIHFTLHGTAPTAAAGTNVGLELAAGQSYLIEGFDNITNFRCIDAVSGSAGIVKVQLFS
jgi:hypothetical protein